MDVAVKSVSKMRPGLWTIIQPENMLDFTMQFIR